MCVSPLWLRKLVAKFLGSVAVMVVPRWRMQMAEANRLIGGVETVFLTSRPEYGMISSTIVRDCASHGAPIDRMVPKEIIGQIYDVFGAAPRTERKG